MEVLPKDSGALILKGFIYCRPFSTSIKTICGNKIAAKASSFLLNEARFLFIYKIKGTRTLIPSLNTDKLIFYIANLYQVINAYK